MHNYDRRAATRPMRRRVEQPPGPEAATQLALTFAAPVEPAWDGVMTAAERFEAFHAANPHVAETLAEMALELRHSGRTHYGIKALVEVLRFRYSLRTTGDDEFKINNSYTAFYARLLMREYPELDGFFELRERRAA